MAAEQNNNAFPCYGSAWAIVDRFGRAFSAPGDSGSLVLDNDRRVIGLLFATQSCISYCIPFAAVMKDIEFVPDGRVLTPKEDSTV